MNTLTISTMKLLVRTVGRLSDGVRIACDCGLTSGKTVNYVYRNRASGRFLIGRLFDRIYLSHRSWRAVRLRRQQLEGLLERAIREQLYEFGSAFVLDVASGQADYLQSVLRRFPGPGVEALCWDLEARWLEEGRRAADAAGLSNIRYLRGDALDPDTYRRLPRPPTIVIASGFYDWMDDDAVVRRSLRLIHDALASRGMLLFTIQTGHADLEFANRVFAHFDGGPLRMKTRTADEVHGWVRQAGFVIDDSRSDEWGYYTVTAARKSDPPPTPATPRPPTG